MKESSRVSGLARNFIPLHTRTRTIPLEVIAQALMILLCSTQHAKTVHINELETYSISPWFIFLFNLRVPL
jgi:hypothetical protein